MNQHSNTITNTKKIQEIKRGDIRRGYPAVIYADMLMQWQSYKQSRISANLPRKIYVKVT